MPKNETVRVKVVPADGAGAQSRLVLQLKSAGHPDPLQFNLFSDSPRGGLAEVSKDRGAHPRSPSGSGGSAETTHTLRPKRRGQPGSEVPLLATRREENGYLKLKAKVDQGASGIWVLFTDPKLKHQDGNVIFVSVY